MKSDIIKHLTSSGLMPQEEMLEVKTRDSKLFIGIPKETALQEHRVALVPDSVGLLVSHGHRVVVESNAGKNSNFHDKDYSDAGAEISYNTKEVYQADIVMKVAPPTLEEIEYFEYVSVRAVLNSESK